MSKLLNQFALWGRLIRAPFLIVTCIPVLLGIAIAYARLGQVDLVLSILSMFGCMMLHAGANVANDYFDWFSGVDPQQPQKPFSGGSQVIQEGLVDATRLRRIYRTLYIISACIGIYVAHQAGIWVLCFGFLGLFCGHGYSAPPLRFSYQGLGELVTGITFGPLIVLGSYFTQTGRFDWQPLFASLPLGFLITAVLYINEFPDYVSDAKAGKNTWVVLTAASAVYIYQVLIIAALLAMVPLLFHTNPYLFLLYLPIVWLGLQVIYRSQQFSASPERLLPIQAKTMLLHTLLGLLLVVAYFGLKSVA